MRILIVDDEALIAQSLQQVLQLLGHDAVCASHPAAALELQRTRPADLLLVDWNMPGGGGIRVLTALTAGEAPPAHVIVVTGLPALSLPPELAGLPVLQKPFRVRQLLDTINTAGQVRIGGGRDGEHA
ncbi:MAG TPA: response regulator [Symbiobacteriaceae bacterium]|nr:response regulator [Symbiobacteriaceae bacterium]